MKKLALHWQIIIGMVLGVLFGLLFLNFEWGKTFIINWIKPFGTIFINLLKIRKSIFFLLTKYILKNLVLKKGRCVFLNHLKKFLSIV